MKLLKHFNSLFIFDNPGRPNLTYKNYYTTTCQQGIVMQSEDYESSFLTSSPNPFWHNLGQGFSYLFFILDPNYFDLTQGRQL